jgi:F-type H+-transporting ATPase subunit gamma
MPAPLRIVRRRIRSVQSTKKITNAQELIAASRLVRAQQRVAQSRPYTRQLTTALSEIATTEGRLEHPLLERRAEVKAAAVVVMTSDRGFAGPHNANILRTAEELQARLREDGVEPRLYVVGRKGVGFYRFRRRDMVENWTGVSDQPRYDDARTIARTVLDAFLEHEVDEIHMVFADFISAMIQRPVALRVIPLVVEPGDERPPQPLPMYVFEPDVESVLDALLPRYVAARIFTAMLESAASEWSARRRAMSAATDNADKLVESLTREYNQARQAQITQEIMEIVGGAEALQQDGS